MSGLGLGLGLGLGGHRKAGGGLALNSVPGAVCAYSTKKINISNTISMAVSIYNATPTLIAEADVYFIGGVVSLSSPVVRTSGSGTYATLQDLATAAAGNDVYVNKFYDQSGNNLHATQATKALQPKIVKGNALCVDSLGSPAILFDATQTVDNYLSLPAMADLATNVAFTLFCGMQVNSYPIGKLYPDMVVFVSGTVVYELAQNDQIGGAGGYKGIGAGASSTWGRWHTDSTPSLLEAKKIMLQYDGVSATTNSSFALFINGAAQTFTTTAGSYTDTTGRPGKIGGNGTINSLCGLISTVIRYARVLTTEEKAVINAI